ncbi:demethoxyubiquinone hydroxylase family protein [Hwanghaeella sp.]|uniref:demethoxyubiquinone hydroxylase family protein n=1 Tax=Hwanghaeella sp. TaxID=2605943 RepID=UPI003CCBFE7B
MNGETTESRTKPARGPRYLPGDPRPAEDVARMIRVDQAGEFGATRIYAGQHDVLRRTPSASLIKHMAEQEQEHLDTFNKMLTKRRVRPTIMTPIWHVAGYAMGAGSALLGEKAAMACTVAVEEVIDEHYAKQAEKLGEDEADLKATIERFRQEELEHRDIGYAEGAEQAPGYPVLTRAVKTASKLAIWLSERV